MRGRVVVEFHRGKELYPFSWVVGTKDAEICFELLIGSLSLTIGVTVEGPPIPFSPFSLADCTMLSHFSFNDFVAVAFPDLAGDLDDQI